MNYFVEIASVRVDTNLVVVLLRRVLRFKDTIQINNISLATLKVWAERLKSILRRVQVKWLSGEI